MLMMMTMNANDGKDKDKVVVQFGNDSTKRTKKKKMNDTMTEIYKKTTIKR